MKKITCVLCILFLTSCPQNKTIAPEIIETAIKNVVTEETYAYMEKDYQKWASYWDHSEAVLRLDVTKEGFSQTRGWDKSGGHLERFFKENPEPNTSTFVNSNYLIFYDSELAWVAFDQTWTSQAGEETAAKAAITLIKKDTAWKIISYTAIQYDADDNNVDTLGRE